MVAVITIMLMPIGIGFITWGVAIIIGKTLGHDISKTTPFKLLQDPFGCIVGGGMLIFVHWMMT